MEAEDRLYLMNSMKEESKLYWKSLTNENNKLEISKKIIEFKNKVINGYN